MAQNSNLKFLYHIICMLITVMLLDTVEFNTLLFFSSSDLDGYFGDVSHRLFVRFYLVERFYR